MPRFSGPRCRDDFCELLKNLKIGVKVKMVEEVEIDETVFASI